MAESKTTQSVHLTIPQPIPPLSSTVTIKREEKKKRIVQRTVPLQFQSSHPKRKKKKEKNKKKIKIVKIDDSQVLQPRNSQAFPVC